MKIVKNILLIICGFCMHLSILIASISFVATNRSFFEYEYKKGNQAELIGMSEEGLMDATNALIDYVLNIREDIIVETEVNGNVREVFDERETLHMVDVKNLYWKAWNVQTTAYVISFALAMFFLFKYKSEFYRSIMKAYNYGLFIILGLVIAIAIYALIDFNSFWLNFHYVFFDNDLFLLDPNVSIMINMFPETFFFDMVFGIVLYHILSLLIVYLLIRFIFKRPSYDQCSTI